MASLGDEIDSTVALIIDEYRRLSKHNPEHELLKYAKNVTDLKFDFEKEHWKEYVDKFGFNERGDPVMALHAYINYMLAMRDESDKIEGVTREKPKPQVCRGLIAKFSDEEIPS